MANLLKISCAILTDEYDEIQMKERLLCVQDDAALKFCDSWSIVTIDDKYIYFLFPRNAIDAQVEAYRGYLECFIIAISFTRKDDEDLFE